MGFFSKLFGKKEDKAAEAASEGEASTPQAETPRAGVSETPQAETDSGLYGGASLLEVPKVDGQAVFEVDMRGHEIYGIFGISLPADWEPFESDRFRAKSQDETTLLSITLYQAEDAAAFINSDFFRDAQLGMYERFVVEGGYEPYDDLLITDEFITQSFKVDDETQYYLTTANKVDERIIITNIIIRDLGDYDMRLRAVIQAMKNSITPL